MVRSIAGAYVAVAALAVVVAVINIPGDRFVGGADALTPEVAPQVVWHHFALTWNAQAGLGADNSTERSILFPFVALDLLSRSLNIPPLVVNHLWLIVIEILQGVCTMALFMAIAPHPRHWLPAVFCGMAAILNPYVLIAWHAPYPTTQLSTAVFPACMAAGFAVIRRPRVTHVVLLLSLSAVCATGFYNLAGTAVQFATFAGFIAFTYSVGSIRSLVACGLAYVAPLAVWAVPALYAVATAVKPFSPWELQYSLDALRGASEFTSFGSALRLVGEYLFSNYQGDSLYIAQGPSYLSNPLMICASSGLPLLAGCGLLSYRRSWRSWLAAGLLLGLALFATGYSNIFGAYFMWLFTHFHAFDAFRNPFDKVVWALVIAYAVLASVALERVLSSDRPLVRIAIPAAAVALLLVGAYPILVGNLYWQRAKFDVAQQYTSLAKWFKTQPQGRVIELPVAPAVWDTEALGGYSGVPLGASVMDRPLVAAMYDNGITGSQGNLQVDDSMADSPANLGVEQVPYLLGLYGIRYVFEDGSVNTSYYTPEFRPTLSSGSNLRATWRDGALSVLSVSPQLVNPRLYAARRVVVGAGTVLARALACRALHGCRGTAFSDDPVASESLKVTKFAFGVGAPPDRRHDALLYRNADELLNSAVPFGRNRVGPYLLISDAAGTYAFGAGSYRAVGGRPPVGLPWASPPAARTETLCATPVYGFTAAEEINFPAAPYTMLVLRYTGSGTWPMPPILDLTSDEPAFSRVWGSGFHATLQPSSKPLYEAEVFPNIGRAKMHLLVPPQFPGERKQCITLSTETYRVRRAAVFNAPAWLDATEPYYARAPARYADDLSFTGAADTSPPRTLSRTLRWSYPVGDRLYGRAAIAVALRRGAVAIKSSRMMWESNIWATGLVPGRTYDVSFHESTTSGSPPSLLVFDDHHSPLLSVELGIAGRRALSEKQFRFTLPPDSDVADLVVIAGQYDPEDNGVTLGPATISEAVPQNAWYTLSNSTTSYTPQTNVSDLGGDRLLVHVSHALGPFVLVFGDTYAAGWRALTPPGVSARHIIVNGFSNGWLLRGRGTYDVMIRYEGDTALFWGALLAGLTATAALLLARDEDFTGRLHRGAPRGQGESQSRWRAGRT